MNNYKSRLEKLERLISPASQRKISLHFISPGEDERDIPPGDESTIRLIIIAKPPPEIDEEVRQITEDLQREEGLTESEIDILLKDESLPEAKGQQ